MGAKIIDGTHCCTTMSLNHITAAMTYVMWHKETFGMSVYSKEYTFPILFILFLDTNNHTLVFGTKLLLL
jgi:hypothetical protein